MMQDADGKMIHLVEAPSEGKDGQGGSEKRRVPRLGLTSEQFRLGRNGKIFPVSDLSLNGMGIRLSDREDSVLFPIGSVHDGILNLRRNKLHVKARVRNMGRERVGLEFESLSEEVQKDLNELMSPANLGRDLKPIPAVEPAMLWYYGSSGTHLFFWRGNGGDFSRLLVFVLGQYVCWDSKDGITSGRVSAAPDPSEIRGVMRFETMLLDADAELDAGKLDIAKTVILSSNLPEDLKGWCAQKFT